MAFEKIGIGGFLKFNEKQAVAGMARARKGFALLKNSAKKVGAGLSQIGGGLRNSALALAPITAGMAVGIKVAAGFEKQMSAVGAITRSDSEDLAKLTAEAKRMGVVSVFSAQESAEAMEFLGRAGFDTEEIIIGLGGVMNAAAAEGIDLATSADIIAQSVKIMGLEAKDAGHNADVLALASAKSNTNIIALGEALKFGGLSAKGAGLSIEETTAIFGKLADAGLRGSIGGTSFMNMLNKLNKPSGKAADLMKDLGIKIRGVGGRLLKMPKVVENFRKGLSKISDVGKRGAAVTELFGIRGQRAYQALAASGGDALEELTMQLMKSSEGQGAAAEAAEKRLDNFLGSIKLFSSSLEAATIEFFGPFLGRFKDATKSMTEGLNSVLFAIQGLQSGISETELDEDKGIGKTARLIAQGVLDAVGVIQGAFDSIIAKVKEIGQQMEESIGKDRLRQFAKIATIAVIVAGALAPLIVGFLGVGFVASAFGAIISGLATLFLPVMAAIGILIGLFFLIRKENESLGMTFLRVWGSIKKTVFDTWNNVISPFITGFVDGWSIAMETVRETWGETFWEIQQVFKAVFDEMSKGTDETATNWRVVGQTIAGVVGLTIAAVGKLITFVIWFAQTIKDVFTSTVDFMFAVVAAFTQAVEDTFTGMMDLMISPLQSMLRGMLLMVEGALAMARSIPGVEAGFGEKGVATLEKLIDFKFTKKKEAPPSANVIAARNVLRETAGQKREEKQRQERLAEKELKLDLKLEDNRETTVNTKIIMEGEQMAKATSKHRESIFQRTGGQTEPFNRNIAQSTGVAVTSGAKG